jgi:hypothetical protein
VKNATTKATTKAKAKAKAKAKPAPEAVAAAKSPTATPAPAAKPPRTAPKSAAAAPVKTVAPAAPAKPKEGSAPQAGESQRPKLVRDGFTMPESDFALIATLKGRAVDAKRPAKKSELLRAGLRALMALQPPQLVAALAALEPIKTGRPKKGH